MRIEDLVPGDLVQFRGAEPLDAVFIVMVDEHHIFKSQGLALVMWWDTRGHWYMDALLRGMELSRMNVVDTSQREMWLRRALLPGSR